MAWQLLNFSQENDESQVSTPGRADPAQKMKNALRIEKPLLRVWKPNKSDSQHHRETTNYLSDS